LEDNELGPYQHTLGEESMRAGEFITESSLNKYNVTVKVEGSTVKTIIHADSPSHAKMLLGKMFGKDNVQSVEKSKS
jgi:hypothetical protein